MMEKPNLLKPKEQSRENKIIFFLPPSVQYAPLIIPCEVQPSRDPVNMTVGSR